MRPYYERAMIVIEVEGHFDSSFMGADPQAQEVRTVSSSSVNVVEQRRELRGDVRPSVIRNNMPAIFCAYMRKFIHR